MAIFPSDKTQPFVAENGVIYVYEDDRWRVKTYKVEEDGRLPYRIETDKVLRIGDTTPQSTTAEVQLVDNQDNFSNVRFTGTNGVVVTSDAQGITFDGAALMGDIALELDDYETKVDSQAGDQNLQNQIDDLSVSKGKVARYKIENVIGTPVARPGQLSVNTTFPNNVVLVSFGIEDLDGVLTKPMATGDIIEFVDAASSKVSRYRITDATGAPTGVGVEYISGDNDFVKEEEEQVYIYPQNESGASKEYVDAQDALHLPLTGGTLSGAVVGPAFKGLKASGPVITVGTASDNIKALIHANGLGEFANGKINGVLNFQRGKDSPQFKISPNSSDTDWATNIYSLNGGNMRLRTSHTGNEGDHVGSHIILDSAGGAPETKIYHVVTPTNDHMAASKGYVDAQGGGIPAGCIMIWMNSDAPAGWFKLQGGSFDTAANPNLHAYLQGTTGYVAGTLPDWSGRYPGNYGDHINNPLGSKQNQKTAMPSGGAPYHPNSIPNGNTRTFNGSGGTNAYSDGIARPAITEGWDDVTRPKTVAVHFIIKHD